MSDNPFAFQSAGLIGPAASLVSLVKSDTTDLASGVCRALLVGTAGTANLIDASGRTASGVPLQQGYNPIGVRRLLTGGTADNVWAIY